MPLVCIKCLLFLFLFSHIASTLVCISAIIIIIIIYDRACVRACIYMRMHLYPREFAFVYTQKRKRSFLRAFACVHLHACLWVQKLSGCTIARSAAQVLTSSASLF